MRGLKQSVHTVAISVVLASALCAEVSAQCSVKEVDVDKDGKIDQVVIENEWHQITFNPGKGGSANPWVYKPLNKLLTTTYGRRTVFGDEVVEIATKWTRHHCSHAYAYEVLHSGPKVVQLKLHAPLPLMRSLPEYHQVEIRRTYTLRAGSPLVDVAIEVHNGSAKELPFTLLVQHWIWVDGEVCYYYVPDAFGMLTDVDEVTPHGSHPVGSQEPADGWTGYISKTSRLGLAFVMDWKYVDAIEDWLSSRPSAAVQWPYLQQDIPAGKSWQTGYVIYPLVDMESLDGATNDIAVGVTVGAESGLGKNLAKDELKVGAKLMVKVCLTSPAARSVSIEAAARLLPDEAPTQSLGEQTAAAKPGEAAKLGFEYTLSPRARMC